MITAGNLERNVLRENKTHWFDMEELDVLWLKVCLPQNWLLCVGIDEI